MNYESDPTKSKSVNLVRLSGALMAHGFEVNRHHQRHEQREGIIAQIVIMAGCIFAAAVVLILAVLILPISAYLGWKRSRRHTFLAGRYPAPAITEPVYTDLATPPSA